MKNNLQTRLTIEHLVQFEGARPHRLVSLASKRGGLHFGNTQDIEAAVLDIVMFETREHLNDANGELREDSIHRIYEHSQLFLGQLQFGVFVEGLYIGFLHL